MDDARQDRFAVGAGQIVLRRCSITDVVADGIVTAANAELAGGGGVDAAVHRAAGSSLLAACQAMRADEQGRRCPPGQARVTSGYDLCPWVIHAVGPIYADHAAERAKQLLASAYDMALFLATTRDCRSVALPAISAGVYGYPLADAAQVAIERCALFLNGRPEPVQRVIFALFGDGAYQAFAQAARGQLAVGESP